MDHRPCVSVDGESPCESRTKLQPVVLLVDDYGDVRAVTAAYFERGGFQVELAASGREALDFYQRRGNEIDVVVHDVCMPVLDGLETLRRLREFNPAVRCCFFSGSLGPYTEQDLREAGGGAVLRKPCDLAKLVHVVRFLASTPTDRPIEKLYDRLEALKK
jgi:CheY-like chemotaxis protein